ncbi:MAG: hypothetical protein V4662_00315 [Verrucomicrobiota bacterium]
MKPLCLLIAAAALCPAITALSQQAIPDSPAIWREVTGVIKNYSGATYLNSSFTRPHVPGYRTTLDGRVGICVEGGGPDASTPRYTLFMPEKMTVPFLQNAAGSYTMTNTTVKWMDGYANAGASRFQYTDGVKGVSHASIWDETPATVDASGNDVYNVKVVVTSNSGTGSTARTQFFSTPIRIVVSNPKTTAAAITSITKTGTTTASIEFPFQAGAFEPMVVGDGRLLVVRVGCPSMTWTDPVTGNPGITSGQGCDIIYCYYTSGATADASQWNNCVPISHAPYDTRINNLFGFARAPFRDTEGNLIPDGEDIGGSYPWMDRHAKILFLEAGFDRLHYLVGTNWNNSRYPQAGVPEETPIYDAEDGGKHQCVSVIGLWTHGKLVQLDNFLNDMDYAVGAGDTTMGPQSRMVTLFNMNSGPLGNENGKLRLGFGRATKQMPAGENDNGNIIDSIENLFNYRKWAKPMNLRDVAWLMTDGKQADEVAFDDYLDPDAFIISPMTGALTFVNSGTGQNYYTHHSGWVGGTTNAFTNPIKLANAATPVSTRWIAPKSGLVIGGGRLEPAATGGVHGKGFWMNGNIGLEFDVLAQPAGVDVRQKSWYIGMFADCRFTDDTTERRLMTFPDGSSIRLYGRRQVLYANTAGVIVNRITLPTALATVPANDLDDLLPQKGWAHLAFQTRNNGTEVDFHLNGILFHRWRDIYTSLFMPTVGKLTLGKPIAGTGITGFNGWVDEFKMIAHAVDFETCCNHAGGTLVGLPTAYTGSWKTHFADRFPTWAHDVISNHLKDYGETSHPKYACYYNYKQDFAVHVQNIPAGAVSLRQSIHFPEGPLFHNAPRPHSVQNQFCISCHHTAGAPGLDLDAISLDTDFLAKDDLRRQPLQPPRRIYGKIPAGLIDTTNQPTVATTLGAGGKLIDEWMLGAWTGPATVQSWTVVDATGEELMPLTAGAVIDPAKIGTTSFSIRANLNSAQGSVVLQLDTAATNTRAEPPYSLYGTSGNPNATQVMSTGAHTIKTTPAGGTQVSLAFTVASGTRVIADYRDDFKPTAPLPSWSYWWNASGPVTNPDNFRALNWSIVSPGYMLNGLAYPATGTDCNYGKLHSTGGHPGKGSTQQVAGSPDRFVLAAYTVKLAGYYGVNSSFVTVGAAVGNGLALQVYKDTAGGTTFTNTFTGTCAPAATLNFNHNVGQLQVGDIIYIGVGPNTTDGSDGFSLDYSIVFNPTANPVP